jgi:hypothetical protein
VSPREIEDERGDRGMESRLVAFVHSLYFELQTIEGVRPLEIWNGVREIFDPYEKTLLVKNLYKIVVPLVNEQIFGRPFEAHSARAREAVAALLSYLAENPDSRVFDRFPYPPVGDGDQKELYRLVQERAATILRQLAEAEGPQPELGAKSLADGAFPDGLFDFREMRIVDNELPYIIFTDKEFRVIHGLAIVYLWLIDLDGIFAQTLEANGVDAGIIAEYRQFTRKVHRENPLTIRGRKMDTGELIGLIHEKLREEDYLDVFENVYTWFEQTKRKLAPS